MDNTEKIFMLLLKEVFNNEKLSVSCFRKEVKNKFFFR